MPFVLRLSRRRSFFAEADAHALHAQPDNREDKTARLGNDGGVSGARRFHVEHRHEKQVQPHVDYRGDYDEIHRAFAVAHAAQYAAYGVVTHYKHYADGTDEDIVHRLVKRLGGRLHYDRHLAGQKQHDRRKNGGDYNEQHGG